MRSAAGWVVYSRPECSLCEQLYAELAELLGDQASGVRIVDITGNPDLEARYGTRVPVVCFDGDFVCAYRLDAERVRRYLAST